MKVTVVCATPSVQDVVTLDVEPGATAADAVQGSGLPVHHGFDPGRMTLAIRGRRVRADARLADGDRVDITRPLVADAKEARRRRATAKPPPASHGRRTRARA